MPKDYIYSENKPMNVAESAVAYQQMKPIAKTVDWNPNYPIHATQEEWWEHIHQIEEGPFSPVSEVHQRISQWLDNRKK